MSHKYLNDIGVEHPEQWREVNKKRNKRLKKERKKYGFDSRETWDLEYTFYCWLYERLKMYLKFANKYIDLEFYKFKYKEKEYTQIELINIMIERLEYYFNSYEEELNLCGFNFDKIKDIQNNIKEIAEIWAIVLPVMGW